jgi:hypothetical protein
MGTFRFAVNLVVPCFFAKHFSAIGSGTPSKINPSQLLEEDLSTARLDATFGAVNESERCRVPIQRDGL